MLFYLNDEWIKTKTVSKKQLKTFDFIVPIPIYNKCKGDLIIYFM